MCAHLCDKTKTSPDVFLGGFFLVTTAWLDGSTFYGLLSTMSCLKINDLYNSILVLKFSTTRRDVLEKQQ